MTLRTAVKSLLFPGGAAYRRMPFGLGAGVVMNIDFAHQARIYFGLYEREIAGAVKILAGPGMNCFDIGSGVGYYALSLAHRCGGKVLAVDAGAEEIAQLRQNAAHNDGLDIIAEQAFVGADEGDGRVTLDGLAESHFAPDFIKMDIEGAETDALNGAARLLAEHAPALLIEVHSESLEADCRKLLEGHGYRARAIRPRTWLAEERPAEYNGWLVCPSPKGWR